MPLSDAPRRSARLGFKPPKDPLIPNGSRRPHFIRALIVGICAGMLALGFRWSLAEMEAGRDWLVAALAGASWWWSWPLAAGLLCGLSGWLTSRYAPEASGSGIPHVKGILIGIADLRWRRLIPTKFLGALLALGSGMSLGREGPTVQLGAAAGAAIAETLKAPPSACGRLISCGAGAGLAAAFNAPLAGFIFVLEELRRELSPITYATALIAAISADFVTRALYGQSPSFHISNYPTLSLSYLPLVLIVGLVAGLFGAGFNRGLNGALRTIDGLRLPRWLTAGVLGLLVGVLAFWLPDTIGSGHHVAERLLSGELAPEQTFALLLSLLLVKFVLTILCYASGVPGGIFAPMLVMGAAVGLLTAQVSQAALPGAANIATAFAVIGMAAFVSAVVRAPLTAIVLILEMTGGYEQLFGVSVACIIAYIVTDALAPLPIYEALLQRSMTTEPGRTATAARPTIVHAVIESGSPLDGRLLRDAELPPGCLIVSLHRVDGDLVPVAETRLAGGDEITVVLSPGHARASRFRELICAPMA